MGESNACAEERFTKCDICTAVDPIRPTVYGYPGGEPIAEGALKFCFVKKKDTEE